MVDSVLGRLSLFIGNFAVFQVEIFYFSTIHLYLVVGFHADVDVFVA